MKLWLGVSLGLVVLFVFSLQIEAQGPPHHGPGPKPEELFQMIDTDKDGKISEEEWVQHHTHLGPDPKKEEFFQILDINKDGKISEEEWVQHHSGIFKEIDTNTDGSLSKEEFLAHPKAKHRRERRPGDSDVGGPPEIE